ncbi:hypothetical protein WJX72_000087 [[Myrmecia] bisecta]|uniref:Uncharacterized protein n=1 Tax=[Myrmecia] bisecta TaxID=41462 RepID=A0AAW1PJ36_9CHLO
MAHAKRHAKFAREAGTLLKLSDFARISGQLESAHAHAAEGLQLARVHDDEFYISALSWRLTDLLMLGAKGRTFSVDELSGLMEQAKAYDRKIKLSGLKEFVHSEVNAADIKQRYKRLTAGAGAHAPADPRVTPRVDVAAPRSCANNCGPASFCLQLCGRCKKMTGIPDKGGCISHQHMLPGTTSIGRLEQTTKREDICQFKVIQCVGF